MDSSSTNRSEQRFQRFVVLPGAELLDSDRLIDLLTVENNKRFIERLYSIYLKRDPEPEGLEHHKKNLDNGSSKLRLASHFRFSSEYVNQSKGSRTTHFDRVLLISKWCQRLKVPIFMESLIIWPIYLRLCRQLGTPHRRKLLYNFFYQN